MGIRCRRILRPSTKSDFPLFDSEGKLNWLCRTLELSKLSDKDPVGCRGPQNSRFPAVVETFILRFWKESLNAVEAVLKVFSTFHGLGLRVWDVPSNSNTQLRDFGCWV